MVVCGQHFDGEMISRIQAKVNDEPMLSRRQLSRQVCEWMNWRAPNGRLQEMSCRKALGRLHRQNILQLPERKRVCVGAGSDSMPLEMEIPEVTGTLEELGEITVSPVVSRHSRDSKIVRSLLQRYHYLGAGSLRGAQMRYVIRSSRWGYLGVLTFSSGAWALGDRDQYIGWSEDARRANLRYVISNDRFLILPTVQVKNLASHVLAVTLKQLPDDWEQRYAVRPVLAETFVDPSRFEGTCYRAANWTAVGRTSGRRDGIAKAILVCGLSRQWRECLCSEPPRPRLGEAMRPESAPSWAHEEFGRVRFYDDRLKQRLYRIAQDFSGCPEGSIPEACGGNKARTIGAYRFFQNPKVTMDVLLAGHVEATIERIRQQSIVLVPQDTTTLNYSTHPMTQGLGPIGTKRDEAIGLLLHDTVAFTEKGTPLGVIDAQCWARDPQDKGKRVRRKQLPIEQKESRKWLRSFRKVAEVQKACPNTKLISIGDRESDVYELFLEARNPNGPGLLVRMNRATRRKVGGIPLWDFMSGRPVDGTLPLHIPHSGGRKARNTILDVRFAEVELKPPKRLKHCGSIRAWSVYAREQAEHAVGNDPIEWMLLTTVAVTRVEHAQQRVQWYARRWGIEVYHRTLKSGCRILDRQLGEASQLQACLGIDMVVAWRVFHLAMLARELPDQPCTIYFTDDEWKALCCYTTKRPVAPKQPPSIAEAANMVGAIGGHLGRKNDPPPGTQALWRGLQRLEPATEMYVICTTGPPLHESGP